MRSNWLAKIDLRGPGPLVFSIVVRYCCKRKMLKRTETEETIGFFVTFLSLMKFQFGGGEARLAKPVLQLRKTKKVFANFPRGFWLFPTKFQWFNSVVLEPRSGQFSRT